MSRKRRPSMNRRFNFTGRQKISREHAQLSVTVPAAGPPTFSADLNLTEYNFPADSLIYVEALRHASLMRFDWGTVASPKPLDGSALSDFGAAEGVRFRVKVVEPVDDPGTTQPAQLIAVADRLIPRRIV